MYWWWSNLLILIKRIVGRYTADFTYLLILTIKDSDISLSLVTIHFFLLFFPFFLPLHVQPQSGRIRVDEELSSDEDVAEKEERIAVRDNLNVPHVRGGYGVDSLDWGRGAWSGSLLH